MSRSHRRPGWTDCGKFLKKKMNRQQRRMKDYLVSEDYIHDIDFRNKICNWAYSYYRHGYRNPKQILLRFESDYRNCRYTNDNLLSVVEFNRTVRMWLSK